MRNRPPLAGEGADPRRKPRQLARDRAAVENALADAPTHLRLLHLEFRRRRGLAALPQRALLLLGVGAGCGGAFDLAQLRSPFATPGTLERGIGLPVLGAISTTLTEAGRELRKRRLKYFIAGSGGLAALCVLLLAVEFIQRVMVA